MAQQQAIHKFVLGTKELESAEFQYDKGWYSITDIIGEERNVIYKSKNAQEAYMKWNVYIGRKKERLTSEERRKIREEQRKDKDGSNRTGFNHIPQLEHTAHDRTGIYKVFRDPVNIP